MKLDELLILDPDEQLVGSGGIFDTSSKPLLKSRHMAIMELKTLIKMAVYAGRTDGEINEEILDYLGRLEVPAKIEKDKRVAAILNNYGLAGIE